MSNDLATLNAKLATALRDPGDDTWTSTEMDDLLTWAVAQLYPRISYQPDPTTNIITLVAATYFYALPAAFMHVFRMDRVDSNSIEMGKIVDGSWEVVGDPLVGTAQLHIAPIIVTMGGTLRIYGDAAYDLVTNLPPDIYVPLILAVARAEAYRRLLADRERFKAWQARNQTQNVTMNEMILAINEADAEANRLWKAHTKRQLPVPARVG